MIWVLDASVAVRWFIEEEVHPHADEVLDKLIDEPERFAVPELFAFEVFSPHHKQSLFLLFILGFSFESHLA